MMRPIRQYVKSTKDGKDRPVEGLNRLVWKTDPVRVGTRVGVRAQWITRKSLITSFLT